jgi:hypothetical protein
MSRWWQPVLRTLLALFCLLLAGRARAHPLSPAAVDIEERGHATYHIGFRRSAASFSALTLALPADCRIRQGRIEPAGDALVEHLDVQCAKPLEGRRLSLRGLGALSLGALVSLRFRDGSTAEALLDGANDSLTLPRKTTQREVFVAYLTLGIEHLLSGVDHLLFVLGLLGIVRGLRATFLLLSAFTLGHSVTLCLAALGLVRMPGAPVELGIALSLLLVAHELTRPAQTTQNRATSGLFLAVAALGLLHGLGFAGALADVGLPEHAIPLSLFAFNLGVEVGQLLACIALAPCLFLARTLAQNRANFVRMALAYGIGSMAALWCIERTLLLFRFS